MLRGLYTAYTGMRAQQNEMNVVTNNLANVTTTGYKKDDAIFSSFKEVLAIKMKDPEVIGSRSIGTMTLGAKVDKIYTDFAQGSLNQTGNPLDIALQGQGFFQVGIPQKDGTLKQCYTRDGALALNEQGELMTRNGEFVMGENGKIVCGDGPITINSRGVVYQQGEAKGQLQLTTFSDTTKLKKIGDNLYTGYQELEGEAFTGKIEQGFLENSNVNSVQEMVKMITVNRAYESNQRVLTAYDATLEKAVNSIGRV